MPEMKSRVWFTLLFRQGPSIRKTTLHNKRRQIINSHGSGPAREFFHRPFRLGVAADHDPHRLPVIFDAAEPAIMMPVLRRFAGHVDHRRAVAELPAKIGVRFEDAPEKINWLPGFGQVENNHVIGAAIDAEGARFARLRRAGNKNNDQKKKPETMRHKFPHILNASFIAYGNRR